MSGKLTGKMSWPWLRRRPFTLFALVLLSGQPALGSTPKDNGLVRDLELLVRAAQQRIWSIDSFEIQDLMSSALLSVCVAHDSTRVEAKAQIEAHIRSEGGPARELWQKNGHDLDALAEVLTWERTFALLNAALERSRKDCPFYLVPKMPYRERHRPVGRPILGVEGGGLFNMRHEDGTTRVGGGGAGRLVFGYGWSPDWAIRMGVESGGAGFLHRDLQTEDIDVDMYFGVPLVLRHRSRFWHQDMEVAGVAVGVPWRDEIRWGGRLAGLMGVTYPRLGALQPWFGLRMGFEYCPAVGEEPAFYTVRIGFRVGVDLHMDAE